MPYCKLLHFHMSDTYFLNVRVSLSSSLSLCSGVILLRIQPRYDVHERGRMNMMNNESNSHINLSR
jgi:hypothetical protein